MSSAGWDVEALREPMTPERPCGESLDGQAPLTTLDSLRLFGLSRSPDAPLDEHEAKFHTRKLPDWREVRTLALEGLHKSKDVRLLAYFGAAALRTDGLAAFFESLTVASHWVETYWKEVYPVVDDDAMERMNALNCFADPMAVLEQLRRTPLVESRQHGRVSLRAIDIAKGTVPPGKDEARAEPAQIDAAFGEMPLESLTSLHQGSADALGALRTIDARMRESGGADGAPAFEPLVTLLGRVHVLLQGYLAGRTDSVLQPLDAPAGTGTAAVGGPIGAIASRQEAMRALDAVAEFFRKNEPSSPVPLLVDRARRLVSMSFLEVLADIAPDALSGVRAVGGLKDGE